MKVACGSVRSAGLKAARRAYRKESAAARPDPAAGSDAAEAAILSAALISASRQTQPENSCKQTIPCRYNAGNCHQEKDMCGRFGLFPELDALAEQFNFDPSIMQDIYTHRWNIPPTTPVLSIHHSPQAGASGENEAKLLRWGMTGARHPRARGSSRPLFNARAETVHRLPSFRQPFRERRCLIPASGFYEWIKDDSGDKTPVWFHRVDDRRLPSQASGPRNERTRGTSMPAPSSLARRTSLSLPCITGCR